MCLEGDSMREGHCEGCVRIIYQSVTKYNGVRPCIFVSR
jgi:hypothetical protein